MYQFQLKTYWIKNYHYMLIIMFFLKIALLFFIYLSEYY